MLTGFRNLGLQNAESWDSSPSRSLFRTYKILRILCEQFSCRGSHTVVGITPQGCWDSVAFAPLEDMRILLDLFGLARRPSKHLACDGAIKQNATVPAQ